MSEAIYYDTDSMVSGSNDDSPCWGCHGDCSKCCLVPKNSGGSK